MSRDWYRPYNYQTAVEHVKKYQKNRTHFKMSTPSGAKLVLGENFAEVLYYGHNPVIRWYEDGRRQILTDVGYGQIEFVRHFTGMKLRTIKGFTCYDSGERTPQKTIKCNQCHGYQRMPEEGAEEALFELLRNTDIPILKSNGEPYREGKTKERDLHRSCWRCNDTGQMVIGGRRVWKHCPVPPYFITPGNKPIFEGTLGHDS